MGADLNFAFGSFAEDFRLILYYIISRSRYLTLTHKTSSSSMICYIICL